MCRHSFENVKLFAKALVKEKAGEEQSVHWCYTATMASADQTVRAAN